MHRDLLLEILRLVESTKPEVKTFLSYSTRDQQEVRKIYRRLDEEGFNPWMAPDGIRGGQTWADIIPQKIEGSHFFIACLSRNTIHRGDVLQAEHDLALKIKKRIPPKNFSVIPVLLEDLEPRDIPEYFSSQDGPQWISGSIRKRHAKLIDDINGQIDEWRKGGKIISAASTLLQIYLDNEKKLGEIYENEAGGESLYKTLFTVLEKNKMIKTDYSGALDWLCRNCHDNSGNEEAYLDVPSADSDEESACLIKMLWSDCLTPAQKVCVRVAAKSGSEFVYASGESANCNHRKLRHPCTSQQRLWNLGISAFPVGAARQRIGNLLRND